MKHIVFMGTPEIAAVSLRYLVENNFSIPLVITQPDKPKGRGKSLAFSPVKEYALSIGLNVYQPEKVKNNDDVIRILKDINPDFFAVVAYGKILPQEVLDIPKYAPINVHFSLLPKYRGPAPVNWAVMNGEVETGVNTMLMDAGMDTGDILLEEKTLIGSKNAEELAIELSVTGAKLLIKTINQFETITPKKQDHEKATRAPMMNKEMGLIDWNKSALEIERMTRAFIPWPAAYSKIGDKTLKIYKARVINDKTGPAGTVIDVSKNDFTIATGKDAIIVEELQLEGKKRMDTKSFLTGFNINIGDTIG